MPILSVPKPICNCATIMRPNSLTSSLHAVYCNLGYPKMCNLSCRDQTQTTRILTEARKAIMAPLSAASSESYTRAYPFLVKLHMLQVTSNVGIYETHLGLHDLAQFSGRTI